MDAPPPLRTACPGRTDLPPSGRIIAFCLLHNAALEHLRGVSLLHIHRFLKDDRAAIALFTHEMHRGTRYLHAIGQRLFVDVQTIAPFAAKDGINAG